MQLSKLRARTSTRKLAGVSIPRENRTSGAFKKASAAAGHAPDAGVADGSSSARMRTDRPGRARGGRVKREGGGATISEDSKKEAAELRSGASRDRLSRNISGGVAGVLGVLGSTGNKMQRSGNKPMAAATAASSYASHLSSKSKDAEAERIEKGKVKTGEEDRKSGGPVKRAYGGRAKKRQDGGSTISEDSKAEAQRLKNKMQRETGGAGALVGSGLGLMAGNAGSLSKAGKVGRIVGAGLTALGAGRSAKVLSINDEDRERERITAGRVKPSEEDRKSGGSVKKGGK